MRKFKFLFLPLLVVSALTLSGCLHIIEDVTFRNNGSGSYTMSLDMHEMKGMMDMMKTMVPDSLSQKIKDSTAIVDPAAKEAMGGAGKDNSMAQMGQQLSSVAASLKGVEGITNVKEVNDSTNFKFGYSFEFTDMNALNRALKIIAKDKFDSKSDEVFRYNGKEFERLATGDIGSELKRAMMESGGEEQEGGANPMEMLKTFFADMSYKTVYHFPDRKIKKNSNELGELSDDDHTLSITLKPFNEDQQKKKASIATKLKLK